MSLSEAQIERYSRHIILPELGGRGQERLLRARIAVVGTGNATATAAIYLGAAGVGALCLCSPSSDEASDLAATIAALNPDCSLEVDTFARRLESAAEVSAFDIVVAAGDSALLSVHDVCREAGVPLTAIWGEGASVAVGVFDGATTPCMRCCNPEFATPSGLFAAAAESFSGNIAALEALKLVLGIGQLPSRRVLLCDGMSGEVRDRAVFRRGDCACAARDTEMEGGQ